MIRRSLRRVRAQLREWTGSGARVRAQLDGSRAAVLMYHRVLPADRARRDAVEPGMFVTPATFARHLDWLVEAFRVLPLGEIAARLRAGRPLPERACAITFDDGWRDNSEHALPALEARGLPATVFAVTGRVGTPGGFWADEVVRRMQTLPAPARREVALSLGVSAPAADPCPALLDSLKELPAQALERSLGRIREATSDAPPPERELLDWDELERMARAGVAFESHGVSHAALVGLGPEALEAELRGALRHLRERGHARDGILAYPFGLWNATVATAARRAGYTAAFTTARGLAAASDDAFALPRIGLHEDVSATRVEFLERFGT